MDRPDRGDDRPADLRLAPQTLVQPDVFVLARQKGSDRDWIDAPAPFLAVEILSPTTAARDRNAKRRLYLNAGVEEYWTVDIDGRVVERWHQGDARPEIVDGTLDWVLRAGVSGSIGLPALLKRIDPGA